MRKITFYLFMLMIVVSCGTNKSVVKPTPKTITKSTTNKNLSSDYRGKTPQNIKKILKDAEKYIGVPYKMAGTTSAGFDCSGLVCKVFEDNQKKVPRRSADQALVGEKVSVEEIQPGDLVFFATAGGTRVSHVGIVHSIADEGEIKFIHSSTSKGVIISSLNEKYWNKAFLFARRLL
ncbi:MAG: C40 family peptidase [Bergeyella zoohelcum]|nr:C40 family peptidase [Bergeyella zoohelcum]